MITASRSDFRLLLGNELRLYKRSGQLSGASIAFLVIGQVLLHLIALMLAFVPSGGNRRATADVWPLLLSAGLLAMLLLMTSRALAGAVQSLYTRGDLDLLLSSPVDRRAVIGVRMSAIVLTVALEVALLVWPFANVFVLFGRVAWFKAYLLVPAMAMLATSIALAVTLLSFRTIGPRRTRVAVQVLAVVMGMGMMLAFYLPGAFRQGPSRGPVQDSFSVLAEGSAGYRELLLAPAQWVMHGFLPTLAFLVLAAGLIVVTIHLTGDRLVQALTGITGGAVRKVRAAAAGAESVARSFGGSFRRIIVTKELKLIARDPFLIAQILQQSLMVLPMAFVLWRSPMWGGQLPLAWLAVIWLAAGLAGPLAWLTLLAEDAPDLLASAPVSRAQLVRAKIEAALLPVLPICALPLIFLLRERPWYAVCVSLCSLGGALTLALLNMRDPVVRRRDTFKARYKGKGANGLVEMVLLFLWTGACLLLVWAGGLLGWR